MEGICKLPIGIQDFEKLRKGGYLYIDKTELIYKLVSTGCYYFLSRPRRFGKSLLISTLKAFFLGKKELFGALKSMDAHIKFALLTGVTKFGNVSVFSDLNHLSDLSMDGRYYDICGITEQELLSDFVPEIEALAKANGMNHEECVAELKRRYDGYHFHKNAPGIYNPYSVLTTLIRSEFGSYWFETGTPSYLVYLLQKHDYNLEEMSHVEADTETLNSTDAESTNPIPVIYQSGYLTIKDYDARFGTYTLGFPNEEVEEGFTKFLMPHRPCREDSEVLLRYGVQA